MKLKQVKLKRDAKTGLYITDEQAAMMDEATWVEETVTPSIKSVLRDIYEECVDSGTVPAGYTFKILPLTDIKVILNEYGAEIE